MSFTREQLEALGQQMILTGNRRTSAAKLRQMNLALIEALSNIIDDKNQGGGFVGIPDAGFTPSTIAAFDASGRLISLGITVQDLIDLIAGGGYDGDPAIIDQDDTHRFVTTANITDWDSKDAGGAAATAENNAKDYADDIVADLESDMNTAMAGKETAGAAAAALSSANSYTDGEISTLQTYVDTGLASKEVAGAAAAAVNVKFSATEDIAACQVVTSTGKVADTNTPSHRNKVIGLALADVASGFVGDAKAIGMISNISWSWTVGDKIFLNGTTLSTTPSSSGWSQMIGAAVAADKIEILLGPAILL